MEVAASIIAIIQITERVASACKSYIEAFQDYPKDLRLIYVETTSLKAVFEGLSFFDPNEPEDSAALRALKHQDGPIEGCRKAMEELNKMLPRALPQAATRKSKKQKLGSSLTALAWPFKCERARKLLDEILVHKSTINMALTGQILHDARVIKGGINQANQALTDNERRDVCNWFEIVNPSSNHNSAARLFVEGTADWVSRAQPWIDWTNRRTRALWIHGIPGAGKTILAAHLIGKVLTMCAQTKNRKVSCVYFYCYHGHNRDETAPFLRWLLGQLFRRSEKVPERAFDVFTQNEEPDVHLLKSILVESLLHFETVWVMVDALDESRDRENLLGLLRELIQDSRFRKVQLFATSRQYFDIEQAMLAIAEPLSLSNPWVEADIKTYVAAKIKENREFCRWPVELREEVEAALSKGAKGMFRWAVCQLDILRRLKTTDEIRKAITDLPETLDETYERIFSYIDEYDRDLVRHTLQWLHFHTELWDTDVEVSLTSGVLVSAYLMGRQECTPKNSTLVDIELLKESCGCLITWNRYYDVDDGDDSDYDSGNECATLAHYTVREFLESDRATGCSSFFRLQPGVPAQDVVSSVFSRAMNTKLYQVPDTIHVTTDLDDYCSASALRSLWSFEKVIEPSLAYKFLDPASSRFPRLELNDPDNFIWVDSYLRPYDIFWETLVADNPAVNLSLQLLEAGCYRQWKAHLHEHGIKNVLQSTFSVMVSGRRVPPSYNPDAAPREFRGTALEYIAACLRLYSLNREVLAFILDELPHVRIDRLAPYCVLNVDADTLSELLHAGACPDPAGFRLTSLQMACAIRDPHKVRVLLEAGADPNRTGDRDGMKWDKTSVLGDLDEIHGLSPLRIARTNPLGLKGYSTSMLDQLLLGYQGRDFAITE